MSKRSGRHGSLRRSSAARFLNPKSPFIIARKLPATEKRLEASVYEAIELRSAGLLSAESSDTSGDLQQVPYNPQVGQTRLSQPLNSEQTQCGQASLTEQASLDQASNDEQTHTSQEFSDLQKAETQQTQEVKNEGEYTL